MACARKWVGEAGGLRGFATLKSAPFWAALCCAVEEARMGQADRAGYKIVSEETWEAIKAAYLRGTTAKRLAAHYGVTVYAIYMRAQRQGWTRIAWAAQQPPPAPPEEPPPFNEPDRDGWDLPPPPPPRPAPAIDKGRLAASALEGAAALLAEGRLDEAAAYMKLADMGSRVGEREPLAAPTPEQARRWETAHDFYTGQDPEARDLPVREQWRVLMLLVRHGRERAHVLRALRRERQAGGRPCACRLCTEVEATSPGPVVEGVGHTPATEAEAVAYLSHGAATLGALPPTEGEVGGDDRPGVRASPDRRGAAEAAGLTDI
jgi:hypothetical protein